MISRSIEHCLATETGSLIAQSDGFADAWHAEVERLVNGFGRPASGDVPASLFSVPFQRGMVAVVSVLGRRFHVRVLSRRLYDASPDPFAIADRFPPPWHAIGPLPALEWPAEPLPPRTIPQLDGILRGGDVALLLGASQTLVDCGRIALRRNQPEPLLARDIWALLPDSTRRATPMATFAYSTALHFGLVVLPADADEPAPGYLSEEQARDYPESRYERELQTAIEHADQPTVDRLFSRRSGAETLRLAMWIVAAAVGLAIFSRLLLGQ